MPSRMPRLASIVAAGGLFAGLAQAAPDPAQQRAFALPHQLVDVGGHRLNLHCSGSGAVTVVFEAPPGDGAWAWWAVQPAVALKTRACVYDRAGLGFSDPATRAGTSANAVDDLHALLAAAGVKPPFVLVGNSLGGANVQLYAWRYPDEVKGLVLVEPLHEDEPARLGAASDGKIAQFEASEVALLKACTAESEKGFAAGGEMLANCTGGLLPSYGRELAAAHLAGELSPAYWHAASSERESFDLDRAQLRSARRSFGDLPLVVLTRGVSPFAAPGKPPSALSKAVEAANRTMQDEVARLSTRGERRDVPGAGHLVQDDRPEAVVKAVEDVLARLGS